MTENCVACNDGISMDNMNTCPECGSQMEVTEGCSICRACGHSPCK